VAENARAAGVRRLVAVAFHGETDPALADRVDEIVWIRVGQLGKMAAAFRQRDVRHCVMAGQISPRNLFDLRPDLRAVMVLFRVKERNARTLFGAIADELQKDGVELIDARPWLASIMPAAGYVVGPKLSQQQRDDVTFGFRMAKEVSRLDIGQLVVVKNGTVLAVEGFEGTDACLRRGGELAGKGGAAVAVKVASDRHDFRFDIPCLGLTTVDTCTEARIAVLAFEPGKTLLLQRPEVEAALVKRSVTWLTAE
jgi:DUF1009 family protein